VSYNDAGDRKVHIHIGASGAVGECAYSTQTAATGTLSNLSGSGYNLYIGNIYDQSGTFDGLIDEVLCFNKVLTAAQMLQIVRLSGV
jgi:hypothetical protein